MSSTQGAKRSRRVAGDAPEAPVAGGEGGARGGGPALAASSADPAFSTAIVRSRRRSATAAADDEGSAGGMVAPGITAAEMSRFVEEQLRAVQRDHARELAAVNRDLAAVRSDHSRLSSDHARELAAVHRDHASELSDLRYDNSRLFALPESSSAVAEVGMVCRRHGSGPDAFREYRSVMSVLFNVHAYDLSEGFMHFFTTKEACELRLVHSEFLDAVNATPWHDMETIITGPLTAWRASFPSVQAANVEKRGDLSDADFVHFRGLRSLDMSHCKGVSDAAFVNLRGIDSLRMWDCDQPSITASAFTSLKGIQELGMQGCDLAVTTAASNLLQEARSLDSQSAFDVAVKAADVPESRRLLATRALGSTCWLYAGVTFDDLLVPASAHDVTAAACLELLQVGLECGSVGIIFEATSFFIQFDASQTSLGEAACVAAGAIPALVAALDVFGADIWACRSACAALANMACTDAGRAACGTAGAARSILSTLKRHLTSVFVMEMAFDAMINMCFNSSANVATFVSQGAIPLIAAAFQKCSTAVSLCEPFSRAMRNIACFPCGVEACLAADAVPLLVAAYAKHEPARVHAELVLNHLGYNIQGVLLAGR